MLDIVASYHCMQLHGKLQKSGFISHWQKKLMIKSRKNLVNNACCQVRLSEKSNEQILRKLQKYLIRAKKKKKAFLAPF